MHSTLRLLCTTRSSNRCTQTHDYFVHLALVPVAHTQRCLCTPGSSNYFSNSQMLLRKHGSSNRFNHILISVRTPQYQTLQSWYNIRSHTWQLQLLHSHSDCFAHLAVVTIALSLRCLCTPGSSNYCTDTQITLHIWHY